MKRYMMECIGTFFLTIAITLTGSPVAIGLMLIAMIYVGGHVSGGHFNPAISLSAFAQKKLSLNDLLCYWISQSLGACFALFFFMIVTNNVFSLEMGSESVAAGPFGVEALFTMVFCWMYLTMIVGRRYQTIDIKGVLIGLTLMAIAFIGGIFNPAVAIGSICCDVVKNGVVCELTPLFIYIAGPLVGAIMASLIFDYFNDDIVQA